MKKVMRLVSVIICLMLLGACGNAEKRKEMDIKKYNDLRATFVTSQGEINFYLYPEAAPVTVANFINLAVKGYYNNTIIHRAVENFIVQGGDPTGTGKGGPGYTIEDEFSPWLDFYQDGMLAMANAGPNTGGGQFFITTYPADFLNGKHSIFGEVVSSFDGEISKKLERGDVIKEIRITGDYNLLLSIYKDRVLEWNKKIDANYPNLKKFGVRDVEEYGDLVARYNSEIKKINSPQEEEEEKIREFIIPKFIRKVEDVFTKDEEEEEIQSLKLEKI